MEKSKDPKRVGDLNGGATRTRDEQTLYGSTPLPQESLDTIESIMHLWED